MNNKNTLFRNSLNVEMDELEWLIIRTSLEEKRFSQHNNKPQ